MAFGAVGGIESGVTIGEKFDVSRLLRAREIDKKIFQAPPRVYVNELGIFLTPAQAEEVFRAPRMKVFACRDTDCCRQGVEDMLRDPRRHFTIQRMREVGRLSQTAEEARASVYLEEMLRPPTDRLPRVLKVNLADDTLKKLENERNKLERWRYTLGNLALHHPATTFSPPPKRPRHGR